MANYLYSTTSVTRSTMTIQIPKTPTAPPPTFKVETSGGHILKSDTLNDAIGVAKILTQEPGVNEGPDWAVIYVDGDVMMCFYKPTCQRGGSLSYWKKLSKTLSINLEWKPHQTARNNPLQKFVIV